MNSTKETKVIRAEKETAQSRRSFLRLGALGAAAVIAAGVLPGTEAKAQANRSARKAATVRSGGAAGTATGGKQTRSARKMRSMGEVGAKGEARGGKTRSARRMSSTRTARSTKATKSGTNNRSMATRKSGERGGQRSMWTMKATKQMKS